MRIHYETNIGDEFLQFWLGTPDVKAISVVDDICGTISEGIMQASSFGDYFQKKTMIEALLDLLDVRFPSADVQTLKPLFENVAEYQTLRQLLREAARAPSLDEFKRILAANGS